MRRKSEELMKQIQEFSEGFYQRNLRSPYMSEIGAALGIAKSTAQKYLVEMNARGMLSYHAGEIVTEKIQKVDTSITSMGILGSVSCGTPDLAEEYVEQYVSFPTALFGKGEFFILRANGESMIGAGIDDGDLVVVRKQSEANEGQIVVALIENETTLKRLYFDPKTYEVVLHPENERFHDIRVKSCVIQGVAVHVLKSLE